MKHQLNEKNERGNSSKARNKVTQQQERNDTYIHIGRDRERERDREDQ